MIERVFALNQRRGRRRDDRAPSRGLHRALHRRHSRRARAPTPACSRRSQRAREAGYIFAICTNKPEGMAVSLIERLGLADLFGAICGGDTFAFRKPDPRHLHRNDRAGRRRSRRAR